MQCLIIVALCLVAVQSLPFVPSLGLNPIVTGGGYGGGLNQYGSNLNSIGSGGYQNSGYGSSGGFQNHDVGGIRNDYTNIVQSHTSAGHNVGSSGYYNRGGGASSGYGTQGLGINQYGTNYYGGLGGY